MKIKLRYWLLFGVVIIGAFVWGNESYKEAMQQCQKTHSFDTCFYSLNH